MKTGRSSRPERNAVACPNCGHQQWEYAATLATACHACGHRIVLRPDEPGGQRRQRQRIEQRHVDCLHCARPLSFPAAAMSWQCPSCGEHLDLGDHALRGDCYHLVRTYGNFTIPAGMTYAAPDAHARTIVLGGQATGDLVCEEELRVLGGGRLHGSARGRHLTAEAGSRIERAATLAFSTARINGHIQAEKLIVTGKLEILSSAQVLVECLEVGSLSAQRGAQLHGACRVIS